MKERIITALIMIAVMVGIVFFLPILFTPVVTAILLISIWEWCRIGKIKAKWAYITATTTLVLWGLAIYSSNVLTALLCLVVLHYVYAVRLIVNYERIVNYRIPIQYLRGVGPILLSTLAATLIYIFTQSQGVEQTADAMTLTFIIMVIAAADSGAYFAGRALGKHKLCPRVSPKKTIEGLVGGLLTVTVVVATCDFMVAGWYLSFFQLWFISIIAALASVIGDLFISIIKRQNNIKDASQILPGHGGILDRIDGLLAGIPVFYLLQQFA